MSRPTSPVNPAETPITSYFSQADAYDENTARWAPLRQALDWLSRQVMSGLPEDANILCVGAGTGAEVLYLAAEFPGWRFTAVEPSEPMLARCRLRAEEAGILHRCAFHLGFLESLPPSEPFDAATSVLVSQFLTDPDARRGFFEAIAARLRPGGLLVTCDLAAKSTPEAYERLLGLWIALQRRAGIGEEQAARLPELYRTKVAVAAPDEVANLIRSAGFEEPVLFYQAVLFHAWWTRCRGD